MQKISVHYATKVYSYEVQTLGASCITSHFLSVTSTVGLWKIQYLLLPLIFAQLWMDNAGITLDENGRFFFFLLSSHSCVFISYQMSGVVDCKVHICKVILYLHSSKKCCLWFVSCFSDSAPCNIKRCLTDAFIIHFDTFGKWSVEIMRLNTLFFCVNNKK